jgi:hypothetical protein
MFHKSIIFINKMKTFICGFTNYCKTILMSKLESVVTLEYHNNRYTISTIQHSGNTIPILLNRDVYKTIKRLDKKWYINDKNHVYCFHDTDDDTYQVYLHEVVMRAAKKSNHNKYGGNSSSIERPIVHTNNIHFDNRIENLQYDTINKNHSKTKKKKCRTINLSKYGINVNALPTYTWYCKPNTSHGHRFAVELPNGKSWRTTASKRVSLRYKLEEAKKYLRYMKETDKKIFETHSMNGDLTSLGLKLYDEYAMMIQKAGFMIGEPVTDRTDLYLEQDTSDLTNFEIYLLENFNPRNGYSDINDTFKKYQSYSNQ